MLERTPEVKVLRDPIHGYIHIDLKVVWDCLNTREFQRLRRIHQLGGRRLSGVSYGRAYAVFSLAGSL